MKASCITSFWLFLSTLQKVPCLKHLVLPQSSQRSFEHRGCAWVLFYLLRGDNSAYTAVGEAPRMNVLLCYTLRVLVRQRILVPWRSVAEWVLLFYPMSLILIIIEAVLLCRKRNSFLFPFIVCRLDLIGGKNRWECNILV